MNNDMWSDYYPAGAGQDTTAPYNESKISEEVVVTITCTAKIKVRHYEDDSCGIVEEIVREEIEKILPKEIEVDDYDFYSYENRY